MHADTAKVGVACHVVQFYRDESELAEGVAGYLSEGLRSGGVAIVVATAGQQECFEAELRAMGVDCARARAVGTYITLDAEETMERFTEDHALDPAGFQHVVGGLIRGALDTGRPVYVYGGMVALLWEAG